MAGERKLRSRKRRFSKGRRIAISDLVYDTLNRSRRCSWDTLLRRMLGLADRNGDAQPLIEGMLETTSGMFMLKLPGGTWSELEETAYKMADQIARKRRMMKLSPPIRMREVK